MSDKQRILIISNNSFNEETNNGKTLLSFFSVFESAQIAQLFFKNEMPSFKKFNKYYKLTDKDMILFKFGGIVEFNDTTFQKPKIKTKKISDIKRILRELIWIIGPWRNPKLNNWLNSFNPDIIFFVAGDSIFSYRITSYIQKKFNAKLVTYITDDYILPRTKDTILGSVRRYIIKNRMQRAIVNSKKYFVISEAMKKCYSDVFGKSGIILNNAQDFFKKTNNSLFPREEISLVYAGGLHYKRFKTLIDIKQAIEIYNKKETKKIAKLYIYSNPEIDKNIVKELEGEYSSFCGLVKEEKLVEILNSCDIPVFVESFDSDSIEATRLSLSTKISEYLSLEKPILAVGPECVSSMMTLKDVAYCITCTEELNKKVAYLLGNVELQKKLSVKASKLYSREYNKKNIINRFKEEMNFMN
ncbi:glycosyltransferase [Enterococcus mediterraneensis]|uniref:glycosyltransferase n=1 Tax=Enterococcus mediterraneensis TaxID=2364791 RepID=UPI000F049F42|nr:glycosyltransferase [Enterococcus mediterraneensis]